MPDMKDKNLERLRNETHVNPPLLNAEILAPRNSVPTRKIALIAIPVAAAIAVTLTLAMPSNQTRQFTFPSPSNQTNDQMIFGPMVESGVSFTAAPYLSDLAGKAKVWSLEPVTDLIQRRSSLADLLGYEGVIGDEVGRYVSTKDLQPSSLAVSPANGQWLFQDLTHTLSVYGVCLGTKLPGACDLRDALLSASDIKKQAKRIFTSGGFTGSDNDISVIKASSGSFSATATLVVDGLASPIKWSASWYEDGVLESARGFLATVKDLGEFEIVSPKEAVQRADDFRQWTASDANSLFSWAPPVGKLSAQVNSAKLTIGYYKGFLVPSYHLAGSTGDWYRDVNALVSLNK